ncbi:MAG: sensor histidine kinase [Gemmatimonadota bacterium]
MRIRLQLLLPLTLAGFVALGFVAAALYVGDAVGDALITVPGLTADRAVVAAVRVVAVAGVVVTILAAAAGALIARIVLNPLGRMREAAERLAEEEIEPDGDSSVAEIQDVARGVSRAARELRDRHGQAARERAELAELVEAVSEGIIQLDPGGRVIRLNRSARELLRLPEDAEGRPAGALFRNPELRQIMEEGARGTGTEAAEVAVDERRLLASVSPQPGGGAVATFVDLTDLRRLEAVRRDFVANASHELKTPLTSIRGYAETLMSGEIPEAERKQFLLTISRNAERLQRIVDDLLDLSRIEAGRWQPELEPVDVLALARAAWQPFAERATDRGVTFDAESRTDSKAQADRRALEQVFANLFDNALRYTDEKGRIRVLTWTQDAAPGARPGDPVRKDPQRVEGPKDGGAWLVCEVADTGAGIPRDALPRIFERFYRVDPARSREEGGTGLGLSIVRHMLETMAGGVDARSELGKGTTVRLWLPAA